MIAPAATIPPLTTGAAKKLPLILGGCTMGTKNVGADHPNAIHSFDGEKLHLVIEGEDTDIEVAGRIQQDTSSNFANSAISFTKQLKSKLAEALGVNASAFGGGNLLPATVLAKTSREVGTKIMVSFYWKDNKVHVSTKDKPQHVHLTQGAYFEVRAAP